MINEGETPENTSEDLVTYELGYLLAPLIAEENIGAEENKVKDLIEKGGAIISSKTPESLSLAYDITKKLGGKNQRFRSAYFGSVVFRLPQGEIGELKIELDKNESLLRHLLTKRTKESLIAPTPRVMKPRTPKQEEPAGEMNEKEVEAAIEKLVAE